MVNRLRIRRYWVRAVTDLDNDGCAREIVVTGMTRRDEELERATSRKITWGTSQPDFPCLGFPSGNIRLMSRSGACVDV